MAASQSPWRLSCPMSAACCTTAVSFREYFNLRPTVAGAFPDPEDRERMATFFAQTLAAIDWDAFEQRDWLGRGISPDSRLRVEVYTAPGLAGRIELPPEPKLFAPAHAADPSP